jgi:sarcosine oxidase subunit alpha
MAALVAARSGARVIIADEQNEFGGNLLSEATSIDEQPASEWVAGIVDELAGFDDVTILPRSTVFCYYDHNFLAIAERCTDHIGEVVPGAVRQRLWRVRAKQVILAQGAFERPLVFCNNDRPGVMTASAVTTYINRYAVRPGDSAVVFTNNDSAYHAAAALKAAGATVVVVDSRADGGGDLAESVSDSGVPVLRGHVVTDVAGRSRVKAVRIAQWNGDPSATVKNTISIKCDLLAVSGGWSPAVHLHSHAGGKNSWDESQHCFVPEDSEAANVSAGASNGKFTLQECLQDGLDAGRTALEQLQVDAASCEMPVVVAASSRDMQPLWRVPAARDPDRCPKQFVDYQNDTSVADIRLAVREGYRNVEHVKRYTALGFGTDQGKLGNINGMAILAECLGEPIPNIGTTTFRPAYTPVTFAIGAGENVGELLRRFMNIMSMRAHFSKSWVNGTARGTSRAGMRTFTLPLPANVSLHVILSASWMHRRWARSMRADPTLSSSSSAFTRTMSAR